MGIGNSYVCQEKKLKNPKYNISGNAALLSLNQGFMIMLGSLSHQINSHQACHISITMKQ